MNISIKEHFESQIENIWIDPKYKEVEIKNYGYAQQDNQIENSLLFIGINPSNSENDFQKDFYINGNEGTHKYFSKFIEISEKTQIQWSHLDLLFVRETNQNRVKDLINNGDENTKEFLWKQLLLSKEMIELVKPKIVVVNNTLSRNLMGYYGGWMGYEFKFNNELGTSVITNKNSFLNNTPVFFTSMLTGQRALDNGSYERLVWHIKFVNKKITN